jgi:hypothetical protein
MAASNLMAALAGSDTGATTDPTLLMAQPQLTLASALMKSGLDTSAAYPAQALARVLQVGAGLATQYGASSDLAKAYSQQADSLKDVFPENTALGKMLRSGNFPTQLAAVQMAPKAALIQNDPYSLEPQQVRQVEGRPVGTGSPQLAGQVEAAKNPPLVAREGGMAAAKAPYTPAGTGTFRDANGNMVETPISAATLPQMQPGMSQAQSQIPKMKPALQPGVQEKPQATSQQPQNPQASAPPPSPAAMTAPAGIGKPLPNPAIEPAVKIDTEELGKDREAAAKGQQDLATIRAVQDFAPKVKTGWSADTKLEGARIMKGMGVPDDKIKEFMNTDVAAGQILQKKFVELSSAAARNMGAREPGSVIQMFAKAYPNLGTDPQAVTLQTNALYMDRLRQQHLADEKTGYLNGSINGVQSTGQYRGLKGFNETFNQNHPSESYLHAAEAMSGAPEAWGHAANPAQQQRIIDLIPPGTKFLAPNGRMKTKPGSGVQQ